MPSRNHYALVLAGGRGTRFWPRSRANHPKQLIPFLSERSLIQETVERLRPMIPAERIWVLTSEKLRRHVIRQLPGIPTRQILAEPVARNTAPAIGLAATVIQSRDPNAVLGVFPSDHYIARPTRFRRLAKAAFKGAEAGHLMVLGIRPRWAETGYGYIEFPSGVVAGDIGASPVKRFLEKPDKKTARRFLKAGRFYWNAGMFFWRADVFLDSLRRYLPRTASLLASLPRHGSRGFSRKLRETFPLTESISVDYAVLEKSGEVRGIAADEIGWNDIGSWDAVYALLSSGDGANVLQTDALMVASEGNLVNAPGKLVAFLGANNLIVIDTPDALLVASRQNAQQVRDLVRLLEQLNRSDLL